jgi:probable phosphoglycerate mutase
MVSSKPRNKIEELPGVIEMEYGDWSGKKLSLLSRNKLWSTIQQRPSFVRFPKGESFVEMQNRALESVRSMALPGKNILICSHGDVIKAVITGIIGLHLDSLQRITIDPASISVISLSSDQARLISVNQTSHLGKSSAKKRADSRLNLGGGSGQ